MGPWVLLLLLGAALPHSCSSALDVDSAVAFEGPGSFGLSVAQSDDGVLVGAPLDLGGRGRVYRCRVGEKSCRDADVGDPPVMGPMALGMSMAANGSQLLACGPTAQRMCGENAEVPGFCFLLFSGRSLMTTPQACPTSASDIVFLMDGSGSVARFDFQRMKIFIIEVIRRFRGTDTRVRGHGATGLPHSGALANGLTMAAPRNLWGAPQNPSLGHPVERISAPHNLWGTQTHL